METAPMGWGDRIGASAVGALVVGILAALLGVGPELVGTAVLAAIAATLGGALLDDVVETVTRRRSRTAAPESVAPGRQPSDAPLAPVVGAVGPVSSGPPHVVPTAVPEPVTPTPDADPPAITASPIAPSSVAPPAGEEGDAVGAGDAVEPTASSGADTERAAGGSAAPAHLPVAPPPAWIEALPPTLDHHSPRWPSDASRDLAALFLTGGERSDAACLRCGRTVPHATGGAPARCPRTAEREECVLEPRPGSQVTRFRPGGHISNRSPENQD